MCSIVEPDKPIWPITKQPVQHSSRGIRRTVNISGPSGMCITVKWYEGSFSPPGQLKHPWHHRLPSKIETFRNPQTLSRRLIVLNSGQRTNKLKCNTGMPLMFLNRSTGSRELSSVLLESEGKWQSSKWAWFPEKPTVLHPNVTKSLQSEPGRLPEGGRKPPSCLKRLHDSVIVFQSWVQKQEGLCGPTRYQLDTSLTDHWWELKALIFLNSTLLLGK